MKIANAPCSWGVLEFDLAGEAPDYVQVLDEMRSIGYTGTELGDWGFMPTDSTQLRDELQARELTLLGAFVGVSLAEPRFHDIGAAEALQYARLLSQVEGGNKPRGPFIVLSDNNGTSALRTRNAGRICPEHGLTSEEWAIFVHGVHHIARIVREETGLSTVFHPHCAGYIETPAEVEMLMQSTDANLVGLCFDTGHYRFGGGEPLQLYTRYAERVWHVHFKDCHAEIAARSRAAAWDYFASVGNGVFCELGQGEVNFPAIISALRARDYDGWIVVEQDVLPGMGSPRESAARNLAYLQSVLNQD